MGKLALLLLLLLAGPSAAQVPVIWPAPQGAKVTPITASATGTTGAVSVTLLGLPATGFPPPAVASGFTYICGFIVTSGGTTTPLAVNLTVTGTVGGTLNFTYIFVSSGQGLLGVALPGCIASNAPNANIVVNVPAGGAGTTVAVSAWGYTN